MDTREVSIIGAGTAGLIAAKNIALRHIPVVVYDRKEKLGYPARASGVISIKGLKTLGIDYSNAVTNSLDGARIHVGNEIFAVHSKKPVAHVLDRIKLNEICYREGIDAGAVVKKSVNVSGPMLDALQRKSSVIIGADGAVSTVAKHFGFPSIERYILTFKAEYVIGKNDDKSTVELFFNNSITTGFFGWIIPNDDRTIEVGVGVDSKLGNSKQVFDAFLKTEKVAGIVKGAQAKNGTASIIPLRLRRNFVNEEKRVVLVGDAAGQVKATTGGGVVFGGNAAIMAAQAVYEHLEHGLPLASYEREWKKEFGRDIRLHDILHSFYAKHSPRSLGLIVKLAKALGLESFLSEHGDMDSPSLMIKRFFTRGRS